MIYSDEDIEYALQIIHHRKELDDLMVCKWLKDPQHQQLLEEVALWGRATDNEISGNVEKAKAIVTEKIKQRKQKVYLRFSTIAASIIMFLGISTLFFHQEDPNTIITQTGKDIHPTLTLANGTVVNLNLQLGEIFRDTANFIVNDSTKGLACNTMTEDPNDSLIEWNTLKVPIGQTYHILLADGTQVWLNTATELQFPTKFSNDFRHVKLKGEAYFEVNKNAGKPFRVEIAPEINIEVLGTSFNVRAYDDDNLIETVLEKGKILMVANGYSVELTPGDLGICERNGQSINLSRPERLENYTAWRSGKFIFENTPLIQVAKELARWYGLRVKYSEENISDIKISGQLHRSQELDTILKALEKTGKIKFEIQNQTLWIKPTKL